MNYNAFMGILRALVPAIVAYAVGRGWITASSAGEIGAAVITLGSAGWSVATNMEAEPRPPTGSMSGATRYQSGGGMILLALVLSSLVYFGGQAHAADLKTPPVTKAPNALLTGYPYNGSGLYSGISTLGESETPTIGGQTANGLTAIGAGVGGVFGYQWGSGNVAYAVEAGGYWNNLGASATCQTNASCSITSQWALEQRVKAMTPMNNLLSLFPTFNLPSIPALPSLPTGITLQNQHAYLMVGLHEDDNSAGAGAATGRQWSVAPSFGVGMLSQLSNNTALDVWAEYVIPAGGFSVGPAGTNFNQGKKALVGLSVLW